MAWYWWAIIVVIAWIAMRRLKSRERAVASFSALDLAAPWMRANGFDPDKGRFSTYREDSLGTRPGTTIVVGMAESPSRDGGFLVEVAVDGTVVDSARLHAGPASFHKTAAAEARLSGRPLIEHLKARNEAVNAQMGS